MKKMLVWIMALALLAGLMPAGAMAQSDSDSIDFHLFSYYVPGMPLTLQTYSMHYETDNAPYLSIEEINRVKKVHWQNLPSGAVVSNTIRSLENGLLSLPWAAFPTSAATGSRTVTALVELTSGSPIRIVFEVMDSQLKNTGALDRLPGITYIENTYYLPVEEGQTITLPNYLAPRNPSPELEYEYRWLYGDPGEEGGIHAFPVNTPAVYTVGASDNGKLFHYQSVLRNPSLPEEESIVSHVDSRVILILDENSYPIPDDPFEPEPHAPKTGDDSQLLLWSLTALCSLLVAAALLRRRSC